MRKTIFALLGLLSLLAGLGVSPVWGQAPQTTRVIGTIERADGANFVVKTTQAEQLVNVAPATTVFALIMATLADVKSGAFIAVGATPQPDDSQQAIRVLIFPESMRGLGEGHRPWDRPGTTMTNATVDTAVTSVDGHVVTVKYKGGEKKIVIRPDTAILTYVAADRSELKPGASVAVNGVLRTDGVLDASRIVVGRGGAVPS